MKNKLSDVLQFNFNTFISNVHTCLPGRIEKYTANLKQAEVKPLIKKVFKNGEVLALPIIANVPVVFPGTKNTIISYPLEQGDGCLILFSERSMERFLSNNLEDVEPQDPRKFDLSDAICIPGLFTFSDPGKVGNGNDFEILYKDASIVIDDAGQININEGNLTIDL